MARLYVDEQLDPILRNLFIQYGHDAIHTYDVGKEGSPDTEQLSFAAQSSRILVTLNREDFEDLHRLWLALNDWGLMARKHAGILTTWGRIPVEEWAALIHDYVGQAPEMRNRMWEWNRRERTWEPYRW